MCRFHWSDIDADGTWIFKTIEESSSGRTLLPHLMSPEIAERHGDLSARQAILKVSEARGSLIAPLVDYLASPGARVMEQDPPALSTSEAVQGQGMSERAI